MYCSNCGAPLDEFVKFCPYCGEPVAASNPAGSEPESLTAESVDAQPEPFAAEPIYVQPEAVSAAPKRGRRLLAPAILAIISAGLMMILWISNLQLIPNLIQQSQQDWYYGFEAFRALFGPIFTALAGLFLFLFGLVQSRKGKSSQLGISGMMVMLSVLIALLSFPTWILTRPSSQMWEAVHDLFNIDNFVYLLTDIALIVVLMIVMIGAFKNKPSKVAMILSGAFMIMLQALQFVFRIVLYENVTMSASDSINSLSCLQLGAAFLLAGILYRPARTE